MISDRFYTANLLTVAVASIICALAIGASAGAAYYPQVGNNNFHYLVSRGTQNQILSSQVTVYYPGDVRSTTGNQSVQVRPSICHRNGAGASMNGSTNVLNATVGTATVAWTGTQCTNRTVRTLSVPNSSFNYNAGINMSYIGLTVSTPNSNPSGYTLKLIGYRVDPGDDGIVAMRAGQRTGYRAWESAADHGRFYSMDLKFAPGCEDTNAASRVRRISIYDPDQDFGPQIVNDFMNNLPANARETLYYWVQNGGTRLTRAEYVDASNNSSWVAASSRWRPDTGADRETVWVEARYSHTSNYSLHVQNINSKNAISVTLPYDEIYGVVDCVPPPQLRTPTAQIWGNDVRVGGRYITDPTVTDGAAIRGVLTQVNGRTRGSWGEYGVLAPGRIYSFASGSGLANGSSSNEQSDWSPLTFANTLPGGQYGNFARGSDMGYLPDVSQAASSGILGSVTTSCDDITARTITASRAIRCSGTLTITGDVRLGAGPFSEQTLPQLILIADRINILGSVNRVDAWLVSTEAINTCSNGPASLTLSTCNRSLQVNGPVIARSLLLRRTAHADATSGNPMEQFAERFNLRGDAYVWGYTQAQRSGTIRTTYVRELAPRY